MALSTMTAADFIRNGYEVFETTNGGVIVYVHVGRGDQSGPWSSAAFSTFQDYLEWLSQGYAEYNKARRNEQS